MAVFVVAETATAAGRAPPQAAPSAAAPGQPADIRIAAVVNDEAISVYELASRIKMVMVSSGIPDTPEARHRLSTQVLRTMVDERLQIQEARHQNVVASDDEVDKAISQIAKQNNMNPDQLEQFLKQRGIERAAVVSQVSASIVWAKLIRRLAAQTTPVSDEEIDDAMKRMKESANEPQSRVGEIFLPVDNPQQDEEVRQLAERLTQQMRQGARFSGVAQQFSQSPTAAVGGDLGWLNPAELAPCLLYTSPSPRDLSTSRMPSSA